MNDVIDLICRDNNRWRCCSRWPYAIPPTPVSRCDDNRHRNWRASAHLDLMRVTCVYACYMYATAMCAYAINVMIDACSNGLWLCFARVESGRIMMTAIPGFCIVVHQQRLSCHDWNTYVDFLTQSNFGLIHMTNLASAADAMLSDQRGEKQNH